MQLYHAGNAAKSWIIGDSQPFAPSSVQRRTYEVANSLSKDEIENVRNCFIEAALRCQKAGFDAVQIHSCHHYLLANFLSPVWNERTDEYGGDIGNRARLLIEILRGIKEKAPDLPVMCRINAREYGAKDFFRVERELGLEDAKEVAKLLEINGADAIHLTCWGYGTQALIRMMPLFPGGMLSLIEAVKKVVSIPVIAVGRLTPEEGERALRDGIADFVAIGRGLITDPYLPQKMAAGKLGDIAPCIACYNCVKNSVTGYGLDGISCTVNARCGHESEFPYPITKAKGLKKVVIVGGGPAGMEAARIAALRGHNVILYEANDELGGQLLFADKAPFKHNNGLLTEYLRRQVEKAGITVELGKVVTKEVILAQRPDAVIVATGALPLTPEIKGLENAKAVKATDVLVESVEVGDKVIIIGGNMVGCEVADFLADKGKEVTVCEMLPYLLTKVLAPLRRPWKSRLTEKGVKFELGITAEEITDRGLSVLDKDGKRRILDYDTIVLASGSRQNDSLLLELKNAGPEVYCIGDARQPRQIIEAVHEGFRTAYSL